MENNNLIMGRIPTNGGGICKTYPESIIKFYPERDNTKIERILSGRKIFLEKDSYNIVMEDEIESYGTYKELVILNVLPHGGVSSHGYLHFNYLIEVIEKDILYRHLKEERMLLERELENNSSKQLSLN